MRSRQPEISKSGELSSNHRIFQTSYSRDVLNTWGININLWKHTMYCTMFQCSTFFVTPGANISPPWTSINTWKMIHFLKISFRTSPFFWGWPLFIFAEEKPLKIEKKMSTRNVGNTFKLKTPLRKVYYLVVSTHLTNISQNGNLTQIGVKI